MLYGVAATSGHNQVEHTPPSWSPQHQYLGKPEVAFIALFGVVMPNAVVLMTQTREIEEKTVPGTPGILRRACALCISRIWTSQLEQAMLRTSLTASSQQGQPAVKTSIVRLLIVLFLPFAGGEAEQASFTVAL